MYAHDRLTSFKNVYLKYEWRFPDHQMFEKSLQYKTPKPKQSKRKTELNVNRDNQGSQRKRKGLEKYSEINGDISSEKQYWNAIKKKYSENKYLFKIKTILLYFKK